MSVQTVLIPTTWSLRSARRQIERLGLRVGKIDTTDNYYRFRQHAPRAGARYYTKRLPDGVRLVFDDAS